MTLTASAVLFAVAALFLVSASDAEVPFNNTFAYVNAGDFGPYINEYDASYRVIAGDGVFQLTFYNTTPNAYTLALRMGTEFSESQRVFVWEANRANPVRENAVFALKTDGNLVLQEVDGRIAWQTNTADKGVVGFRIQANGNMVLYGRDGKYLWQSFDSPTDTLLVDQYLKLGGRAKLVSRLSNEVNADGPYSLVLEPTRFSMYYTSPVDSRRYMYFSSTKWFNVSGGPLKQLTLATNPKRNKAKAYEVFFNFESASATRKFVLSRPKYNPIYSYMRLGMDGNLQIHIFDDNVDWAAWETTFSLFGRSPQWESECGLPSRCGSYGVCQNNQCVSCPTGAESDPFAAWHKNCTTQKLTSCSSFIYYQLTGVDHFSNQYTPGVGPMTQDACFKKCSADCKCLGFFYHVGSGTCWTVGDLMTLIGTDDAWHLAFIKFPK